MIKLNINLADRSYPIYISTDFTGIGRCASNSGIFGKIALVTDTNVDGFYSKECQDILEEYGYEVYKYVIEAGEKSKNLDTIKNIYKFLTDMKLDRDSTLIALGGGVVGDITGFAAATYLRGINFIQMPTSLLAQADSSVGGKVGVDFEGSKNIIGAFYQPKFVYVNVSSLGTLPKRELQSGLAEVVKHGIICDEDFYEYVDYNIAKIFKADEDVLQYITKVNCTIKGRIVEQDEKESKLRANLNFGHTIGHAIESVSGFELLHGECIALGMVGACRLSQHLEILGENAAIKIVNTLKKAGLPVRLEGLDVDRVYEQMFFDKKIKNNKLMFILPKKIGEVFQCSIDDALLIKTVLHELSQ